MAGSSEEHKATAAKRGPISVALITVSDSRTPETDVNARYLRQELAQLGHRVTEYEIVPDNASRIARLLENLAKGPSEVILLNGGTGISRRDNTFDAVSRKLDKPITGFGELFRMLSYEEIGSAAMLSRAAAGLYGGCVVISIPGSPKAVQLAWKKLIAPELQHLVYEARK
jgi:molybdenum cofactor biosynthesis protein B